MTSAPLVGGVLDDAEVAVLLDVLLTRSPVVGYVVDDRGVCTFSAGAPLARVGLAAGQMVGVDVLGYSAGDELAETRLRSALAGTASSYTWVSPDGAARMQTWLEPVLDASGAVRSVVGLALDITDAWRAEAAEHARVLEQQDVLHQLIAVQDAERRRISAGLHDDTVQVLAALALRLSTLRRRLPGADPAVRQELSAMTRDLSRAGERLRGMVAGLQPELLVRSGLRRALGELLSQTFSGAGATTSVHLRPDGEEPSEAAARVLYEVAVEAVGNVHRHAAARTVRILVERDGHDWLMDVVDDGRGMDPQPLPTGGFGLPSMRQRTVAAGGTLDVTSLPGRGTTVRVRVPDVPPFLEEDRRPAADVRGPLEHVLENINDAFVALDTSWRYVYVNRKAAEMLGTTPDRMLGENIWTLYPDGAEASFARVYETAVREQRSIDFEDYFAPADRWFRNRILPSSGGLTIFIEDVTERRRLLSQMEDTDIGSQVARAWFAGLAGDPDPHAAVTTAVEQVLATGHVSGLEVDAAGVRVAAGDVDGTVEVRPVALGDRRLGEVRIRWLDGSRLWITELTQIIAQSLAARLGPGGPG